MELPGGATQLPAHLDQAAGFGRIGPGVLQRALSLARNRFDRLRDQRRRTVLLVRA
jgi:hypothetical protein